MPEPPVYVAVPPSFSVSVGAPPATVTTSLILTVNVIELPSTSRAGRGRGGDPGDGGSRAGGRRQIGVSAAGEADIDLAIMVGIAGDGFDLIEFAGRVGPDIGPRLGVVGGLPDAIDVVDISDDVDRRIALPGSRRAETEGEDVENVGNGRPGRAAVGRTIKRFICRRGADACPAVLRYRKGCWLRLGRT